MQCGFFARGEGRRDVTPEDKEVLEGGLLPRSRPSSQWAIMTRIN